MPALAELGPLAILVVALGLAIISILIVRAVMSVVKSVVGRVPYLGDALVNAVDAVNQAVLNKLGSAVSGIESAIGWTWHESAKLVEWLGREIYRNVSVLQLAVQEVHAIGTALHWLRNFVHHANSTATGLAHRVARLEKEWHGIERGVKDFERGVETDLTRVIKPQIRGLEHALNDVTDVVIPDLRGIALGAEADVGALRKWISDHFPAIGTTVFAGAVAIALTGLGLGGLNCQNLKNSLKNRACGLWSGLEDLLGLFIDVTIFTNVCAVLDFLSPFVSEVAKPIVVGLTDIGAGLCKGSIGPPPPLPVPNLSLPAAPSDALHLP